MLDGFKSEPILPDKSITASVVTHGVLNASGDVLAHFDTLASAQSLMWIVEARPNRGRAGAGEIMLV